MTRGVARAVDRSPALVLTGLVLAAVAARFALALDSPAPWIFADELIYWELGRSLAEEGRLLVRGEGVYYSALVPLLHAPAHLVAGSAAGAYEGVKLANAVAMAAAAYPAYGLARLALSRRAALAFAAVVLALPAFAYVGTVMTEPLFLTAVLAVAWALARALAHPTWGRQALVLVLIGAAVAVRLQAAVLVGSVVLACLLAAAVGPGAARGLRGAGARLRPLWPLLAACAGAPLLALAVQAARGSSPRALLGGYGELEVGVDPGALADWSVWHLAVVGLSVAVVPLGLAVAAWGRLLAGRWRGTGGAAVLVTSLAVALPMLVQVAGFAVNHADRVQERNLLAVAPLIVLAAMVGLAAGGLSRVLAVGAAALLLLALADLPVDTLVQPPPYSDTFTLLSVIETAERTGVTAPSLVVVLGLLGAGLTAAAVLARRRVALAVLPAALVAVLAAMNAQVTPLLADFSERVEEATVAEPADWIDRAADGEAVAFLWPADADPKLAWQAEIWNGDVATVTGTPSAPPPAIAQSRAAVDSATGRLVPPPGGALPREDLLAAPEGIEPAGTAVARARTGTAELVLWRASRPLRLRGTTAGLHSDGWTGPAVEVRRFGCRGGAFELRMRAGAAARQRVRVDAGAGARVVALRRSHVRTVRVPARPAPGGDACVLRVRPLATASGAELGNPADPRELGVMMPRAPRYIPPG